MYSTPLSNPRVFFLVVFSSISALQGRNLPSLRVKVKRLTEVQLSKKLSEMTGQILRWLYSVLVQY